MIRLEAWFFLLWQNCASTVMHALYIVFKWNRVISHQCVMSVLNRRAAHWKLRIRCRWRRCRPERCWSRSPSHEPTADCWGSSGRRWASRPADTPPDCGSPDEQHTDHSPVITSNEFILNHFRLVLNGKTLVTFPILLAVYVAGSPPRYNFPSTSSVCPLVAMRSESLPSTLTITDFLPNSAFTCTQIIHIYIIENIEYIYINFPNADLSACYLISSHGWGGWSRTHGVPEAVTDGGGQRGAGGSFAQVTWQQQTAGLQLQNSVILLVGVGHVEQKATVSERPHGQLHCETETTYTHNHCHCQLWKIMYMWLFKIHIQTYTIY